MCNDAVCLEVREVEGNFLDDSITGADTIGCRFGWSRLLGRCWEFWLCTRRFGPSGEFNSLSDVFHPVLEAQSGQLAASELNYICLLSSIPPKNRSKQSKFRQKVNSRSQSGQHDAHRASN